MSFIYVDEDVIRSDEIVLWILLNQHLQWNIIILIFWSILLWKEPINFT
jgi:hypothetical protein